MSIYQKTELITPERASELLLMNHANRTPSKSVIEKYARDMSAGKWELTHQGILLGKNNMVIDGQHRLMAVVKSGVTVSMMVFVNPELTSALDVPVDVGHKRGLDVLLGCSKLEVAVGNLAYSLCSGNTYCSASDVEPYVRLFKAPVALLREDSKRTLKGFSTAPVVLAASTRVLLGENSAYIKSVYDAFINTDYEKLSKLPYAASFHRQVTVDRIGWSPREVFTRCMRVFDEKRRDLTKLAIKDQQVAFYEEVDVLKSCMEKHLQS